MTSNRYVVLNCPALESNRVCFSKVMKQCADRTDCLLKRIVDKCKEQQNNFNKLPDNIAFDIKAIFGNLSEKILELLDIEEVE